ncbi:hypothetical protein YC2023_117277 [Brassica napus]
MIKWRCCSSWLATQSYMICSSFFPLMIKLAGRLAFHLQPLVWVVRRSCSCLIVGRWVDLCLGRFGGVTEVVSKHGFVHASRTHDLIGFKYFIEDENLKVEGVRGQTQTRSERGETNTENWAVVWTGHMVRNKTFLRKDFISIWGKRDREGFEESGQVRIMGNQSVMAEQQYEMIQRSFN